MRLKKIHNLILDTLLPLLCLSCRQTLNPEEKENLLCATCKNQITILNSLFCPECAGRLPATAPPPKTDRPQAEAKESPPASWSLCEFTGPSPKITCHPNSTFTLATASVYHNPIVKNLVQLLKFNNNKPLKTAIKPIQKLIIAPYLENINMRPINPEVNKANETGKLTNYHAIIPLPLHPRREKKRGYNQSLLIAQALTSELCVPPVGRLNQSIISNILIRTKSTKPQTETKDYKERLENIRDCFNVVNPKTINNKNVILVDDVYTSGATIKEAVRVLKLAGAKKILAFVIAKT